jgi:hypothetical protein
MSAMKFNVYMIEPSKIEYQTLAVDDRVITEFVIYLCLSGGK